MLHLVYFKHAFQESLKKRAKRNGDGSCILCGIKSSINVSDEVGRNVVTDATDLSKHCYDNDSLRKTVRQMPGVKQMVVNWKNSWKLNSYRPTVVTRMATVALS